MIIERAFHSNFVYFRDRTNAKEILNPQITRSSTCLLVVLTCFLSSSLSHACGVNYSCITITISPSTQCVLVSSSIHFVRFVFDQIHNCIGYDINSRCVGTVHNDFDKWNELIQKSVTSILLNVYFHISGTCA